jgi:hypothetical protein
MYAGRKPIEGTPAEAFLRNASGYTNPRFSGFLSYWPGDEHSPHGVMASYLSLDCRIKSLHLIYLSPEGDRKISERTIGAIADGLICLPYSKPDIDNDAFEKDPKRYLEEVYFPACTDLIDGDGDIIITDSIENGLRLAEAFPACRDLWAVGDPAFLPNLTEHVLRSTEPMSEEQIATMMSLPNIRKYCTYHPEDLPDRVVIYGSSPYAEQLASDIQMRMQRVVEVEIEGNGKGH